MDWTRDLHRRHGTRLVESTSCHDSQGRLVEHLRARLEEVGVRFLPLSEDAVKELRGLPRVSEEMDRLVRLLVQFLRLFRGSDRTLGYIREVASDLRSRTFLDVFEPVLASYEATLRDEGKIDFDHMIAASLDHVREGRFVSPWRYILVDEFQDVSRLRIELVLALRGQHDHGRLFAVGDDWQSIFRFAGSDVSCFLGLDRYAGRVATTRLEETWRCSQPIVDVSSAFVTRNPGQLSKSVRSHAPKEPLEPGVVVHFHGPNSMSYETALGSVLEEIPSFESGFRCSVLALGRYRHSCPSPWSAWQEKAIENNLDLRYLTVHRSKGLEADYVIVVGNEEGWLGFPCEIPDDPVLALLLDRPETFPHAEERRLFYVALTRARRRVYVLAEESKYSVFARELIEDPEIKGRVEVRGTLSPRWRCPHCGGVTIRRVLGRFGEFWGCIEYPRCSGKLVDCPRCGEAPLEAEPAFVEVPEQFRCPTCGVSQPACPTCGRVLVRREGPYGPFLGCTAWRADGAGCGFTRPLRPDA